MLSQKPLTFTPIDMSALEILSHLTIDSQRSVNNIQVHRFNDHYKLLIITAAVSNNIRERNDSLHFLC